MLAWHACLFWPRRRPTVALAGSVPSRPAIKNAGKLGSKHRIIALRSGRYTKWRPINEQMHKYWTTMTHCTYQQKCCTVSESTAMRFTTAPIVCPFRLPLRLIRNDLRYISAITAPLACVMLVTCSHKVIGGISHTLRASFNPVQ